MDEKMRGPKDKRMKKLGLHEIGQHNLYLVCWIYMQRLGELIMVVKHQSTIFESYMPQLASELYIYFI